MADFTSLKQKSVLCKHSAEHYPCSFQGHIYFPMLIRWESVACHPFLPGRKSQTCCAYAFQLQQSKKYPIPFFSGTQLDGLDVRWVCSCTACETKPILLTPFYSYFATEQAQTPNRHCLLYNIEEKLESLQVLLRPPIHHGDAQKSCTSPSRLVVIKQCNHVIKPSHQRLQ